MKDLVNDGFAKVVKPYIDSENKKDRELIAPVEVSPAESAHSIGDQIIYNGILYDVTAQIAVNDPLATSGAGENISPADNIEAQIKATKSQIQTAAAQAAAQNKNTQEMIAPVEEDETDASRAYAIGDQLILDGVLYNVIDAIAQHGIITSEGAGANISAADDITTQIKNHTVTTDATPTQGSTNPVQSGGVYTSEQNIYAVMGANSAKNKIKILAADVFATKIGVTASGNTITYRGITFTFNADKTVTVNGTASQAIAASISENLTGVADIILSGCPSGGSGSGYQLQLHDKTSGDYPVGDYGVGRELTLDPSHIYEVIIVIRSGITVNNLTYKPMIRDASDTDPTFQPFAETNQELTANKVSWGDFSEIGSVNILENDATTQTTSGITFTRNADGSITCSGTATANITYNIKTQPKMEDGKQYLLKSFQSGSSANAYLSYSDIQSADYGDYDGNGVIITKFDYSTYPNSKIRLRILSGTSFETPMTFYPLLTPILDYSGPYAPHAMTNRELTEELAITDHWNEAKVSGFTYFTGSYLKKYGHIVTLSFAVADELTAGTDTKVLALPSGFRPAGNFIIPAYVNGVVNGHAWIRANGDVEISPSTAGTYLGFTTTFIATQ